MSNLRTAKDLQVGDQINGIAITGIRRTAKQVVLTFASGGVIRLSKTHTIGGGA